MGLRVVLRDGGVTPEQHDLHKVHRVALRHRPVAGGQSRVAVGLPLALLAVAVGAVIGVECLAAL